GVGDCAVGPEPRVIRDMDYIDFCFSEFRENGGDGLVQLTVTNRPVVTLNEIAGETVLGDRDVLKIELPDNLHNSHYNWMFQVGSGPERRIPSSFNGSNILELLGEDFLSPSDFGQTISVWLEMDCDAGERLAEGIARRNSYEEGLAICNELPQIIWGVGNFPNRYPRRDCIEDLEEYVNENYNDQLTPELIAQYQSRVSNVIQFQYLKTAPHIVSADSTPVSCYDSDDGEVTITFGRALETGESLNITIGDRSRPTGLSDDNGNPLYENSVTYNDITQFDASNSIVINGLSPSMEDGYAISMMGGDNSINLYTGGEEHTDEFNIDRPIPVSFQITDVINVWCNDGDT